MTSFFKRPSDADSSSSDAEQYNNKERRDEGSSSFDERRSRTSFKPREDRFSSSSDERHPRTSFKPRESSSYRSSSGSSSRSSSSGSSRSYSDSGNRDSNRRGDFRRPSRDRDSSSRDGASSREWSSREDSSSREGSSSRRDRDYRPREGSFSREGKDYKTNDRFKGKDNKFSKPQKPLGPVPDNLIFGVHPVREALESGANIEKIYAKKDTDSITSILDYADARDIQIQYVPIEKLDYLSRRGNHQGILAQLSAIEYADINEILDGLTELSRPSLLVVMDSVTDVRNFGAIARTAESVGADAIIVSAKSSAPVNAEAIKSSAGALLRLPVCRVGSLRNTLKTIQMSGIKLVATTDKTSDLIYEADLTGSVAIIMGSEDKGISVDILRLCDIKVSLPMLGNISSLNVSAAAAVTLYEVVRQRFEAIDEA